MEKTLETIMKQFLHPAPNPGNEICGKCSKLKKFCCKCLKNDISKRKRRRRKKASSCLKTIVCISKIAKDRMECQSCSCHPCSGNRDEGNYESLCCKCWQQLPGYGSTDQSLIQPHPHHQYLVSCPQQVDCCQQVYNHMGGQVNLPPAILNTEQNIQQMGSRKLLEERDQHDIGVQVNFPADQPVYHAVRNLEPLESCKQLLERCEKRISALQQREPVEQKEPVSVHIKVCPCPNINPGKKSAKRLHHAVSVPGLSQTNRRLAEDGTSSDNLVRSKNPKQNLMGNHYETSQESLSRTDRLNGTLPEWPIYIASMKRLAMKMAMANLVNAAAKRERERYFQQSEHIHNKEIGEDSFTDHSAKNTGRDLEFPQHSHPNVEYEQQETTSKPFGHRPGISKGQNRGGENIRSRGYLPHSEHEDIDEEGYDSSPEAPRNSPPWFAGEQVKTTLGSRVHDTQVLIPSSYHTKNCADHNQTINMSSWNDTANSMFNGVSYNQEQNNLVDCCCCSCGTNVYSYNSENVQQTLGYENETPHTNGNHRIVPYLPFPGPCS